MTATLPLCIDQPSRKEKRSSRKIEHVVVLMLENRSFDNILGQLYPRSEQFDGLTMEESNPWHRDDGRSERIKIWCSDNRNPPDLPDEDPGELFSDIDAQIHGIRRSDRPTMDGFVDNYVRQPTHPAPPKPHAVMHAYRPEHLPATAVLAKSFGVSDRWFASAPCETWPNRYFMHCGTAGGYVNNKRSTFPYRWPRFLPTIFRRLDRSGRRWKIYFHDLPQTATLIELWPKIPTNFCFFDPHFMIDAKAGKLPTYSFIEPRYYPSLRSRALPNDQHPPHDLRDGEALVAEVYNALRSSPVWAQTLLVVTYDEHGGCYDHVAPPPAVSPGGPCPDGFQFDRYGVRVPAIVVSPYIPAGSIIRPSGEYPFDHCSIQATLHKLFALGPPLSPRVESAPDLTPALTLDAAENLGPEKVIMPRPERSADEVKAYRRRGHNHHQAALFGGGHAVPAIMAHISARVRVFGRHRS